MSEEAKWYVVHTYSGYENKVKSNIEKVVENRNLQDLIPEVMIPMEEVTEVKGNKIDKGDRKLFPSYVLVKWCLQTIHGISLEIPEALRASLVLRQSLFR